MAQLLKMDSGAETDDAKEALLERMEAIINKLDGEASRRVSRREPIERRMLENLLQYHGRYDASTEASLKKGKNSKLNINLTRPKTDGMSARLMDLLFPTDELNWGIFPTPVPTLTDQSNMAAEAAKKIRDKIRDMKREKEIASAKEGGVAPEDGADTQELEDEANALEEIVQVAYEVMSEARGRAANMQKEIQDQLTECQYHAAMRDVIEDACKVGTGVAKGPVVGDRIRKGWKKPQSTDLETGKTVEGDKFELSMAEGDQPSIRWVNVWSYYPDPDARTVQEGEGDYELHLMNKKQLRELALLSGFEKDAIRRLLRSTPTGSEPSYLSKLRGISEAHTQNNKDVYQVWEYSGPIEAEDMRDLALAVGQEDTAADMDEVDPLSSVKAIVWFCQGEVLKFAIYPMDSGESMYSVFNLVKDEESIHGYGIPDIMRDPQKSLNAAWRAMMDNSGLSSGPQILIAKGQVEPSDGVWEFSPRKIWWAKEGIPQDKRAFETFDVPNHQVELSNIITLSKTFIDDMTAMPAMAQGEQGTGVTKTAQGMAMLMNSANVVFRRVVKGFDDDMTTPIIRRFFDWNMQFSKKEEIKGDYNVDARGSSVLLVREMQAQNLLMMATQFGGHPVYGLMLKNRDMLKKVFQANMIPADEVLLSDTEIELALAKADDKAQQEQQMAMQAQAGPAKDPEATAADQKYRDDELALKRELAQLDSDTKLKLATLDRETQMMKLAEEFNMTVEELQNKLGIEQMKIDSKERALAAEISVSRQMGPSGGGTL